MNKKIRSYSFTIATFLFVHIIVSLKNQNILLNNRNNETQARDTTIVNIDSLKWIMYSMNYYQIAEHFRYDKFPKLPILACDIKFDCVNSSIQDTLYYNFSFYCNNPKDMYIPQNFYYSGIGYSRVGKNYFPTSCSAFPLFALNIDSCRYFFDKKEANFINYLKTYKEDLSSWLRKEAVKRKVLSQ